MEPFVIDVDDPRAEDVQALLLRHLAFAHENTPPEDIHALDVTGLLDPALTLFSARSGAVLLGIGALRELDQDHVELKSMHTAAEVRGRGVGRAMVAHLLGVARRRGYRRVSLETGASEAFAAAFTLYTSAGFLPCEPYGRYWESGNNRYMTLLLH
jgi:putative acetyltransferase